MEQIDKRKRHLLTNSIKTIATIGIGATIAPSIFALNKESKSKSTPADLIIIGGGAIGLATAYYAAKNYPTKKVIVMEQFDFFNDKAASAGGSRQFRIQYNEKEISEMVLASMPLWKEIQNHTQEEILKRVGCLWFGQPEVKGPEAQLSKVIKVMDDLHIPYEMQNAKQIQDRFHFRNVPKDFIGFFQPDGASINVKATLKTLYHLAKQSPNISLLERVKVTGITSEDDHFRVHTPHGDFLTEKLVLTPGPYINDVLNFLDIPLKTTLWEMTSAYFPKTDRKIDYPTWINYEEGSKNDPGLYFGFPDTKWDHPGYVRVAANYPGRILKNMSDYSLTPDEHVLKNISHWVKERMTGVEPNPHFTSNCVCALLNETGNPLQMSREFVLGFAPSNIKNYKNIVIQGTGWVFKMTPLFGKICADLAFKGKSDFNLDNFKV